MSVVENMNPKAKVLDTLLLRYGKRGMKMANKGPKTQKGKERKSWTGDGRRSAPMEKFEKETRVANQSFSQSIKKANEATDRAFGLKKKKTKAKKL